VGNVDVGGYHPGLSKNVHGDSLLIQIEKKKIRTRENSPSQGKKITPEATVHPRSGNANCKKLKKTLS